VLETCLSEGHYLLLTDCDVNTIMSNRKIETVLRNKYRFINSDRPFKLNLGNQEIECNPNFRYMLFFSFYFIIKPDSYFLLKLKNILAYCQRINSHSNLPSRLYFSY